jgi:hypothetical protein
MDEYGVIMNAAREELILNLHKLDYWLARTTAADKGASVTVREPHPGRDRHSHYMYVSGNEPDVLDHVAWIIAREPYQFMYEHLSWHVVSAGDKDGTFLVTLYRSSYAGD